MENRVLFIEDNEEFFDSVKHKLKHKTYRVTTSELAIDEYSKPNFYYGLSFENITNTNRLCYQKSPNIHKILKRKNEFIRTIAYYDDKLISDKQRDQIRLFLERNYFDAVIGIDDLRMNPKRFESRFKNKHHEFICKNQEALSLTPDAEIIPIRQQDDSVIRILSTYGGIILASLQDELQLRRIRRYINDLGLIHVEEDGWLMLVGRKAA